LKKKLNLLSFFASIIVIIIIFYFKGLNKEEVIAAEMVNKEESLGKIFYENEEIELDYKFYMHRFYVPIEDFIEFLKWETVVSDELDDSFDFGIEATFKNDNIKFLFDKDYFLKNDKEMRLCALPLVIDETRYYDLSTLSHAFNLTLNFNYEDDIMYIFKNRKKERNGNEETELPNVENRIHSKYKSYLRIEDVVGTGLMNDGKMKSKVRYRALADMLCENRIPFHIAWIPRFINPKDEIDNDLATNFNLANVDYIYTLDYIMYRGGIIGLHGYSHQSGDDNTGAGNDFGAENNTSKKDAKNQIQKAVDIAEQLNIPIHFFEFPHYAATKIQLKQAEKVFKYIYQPYDENSVTEIKKIGRTYYIPTPFEYLDGEDKLDEFFDRAETLAESKTIGSFFFHMHLEEKYIDVKVENDGYVNYEYKSDSPLCSIIKFFIDNEYIFEGITSI